MEFLIDLNYDDLKDYIEEIKKGFTDYEKMDLEDLLDKVENEFYDIWDIHEPKGLLNRLKAGDAVNLKDTYQGFYAFLMAFRDVGYEVFSFDHLMYTYNNAKVYYYPNSNDEILESIYFNEIGKSIGFRGLNYVGDNPEFILGVDENGLPEVQGVKINYNNVLNEKLNYPEYHSMEVADLIVIINPTM